MGLIGLLRKEEFQPGLIGLFVNPFYFARKGLFENISALSVHMRGRILDVGCGQRPYERLFSCSGYLGMDVERSGHDHTGEKIDVYYDGKTFPFDDGEFDSVLTSQVFEHVFIPDDFLREVGRVLKPGGKLLMTVPFAWDEHEQPYDYARYSSFGIRSILEKNGFRVIECRKTMTGARAVFQLLNAYLFKVTAKPRRCRYLNLPMTLMLMAPVNVLGAALSVVLPDNGDLYLDNVVLAEKVKNA